MAIFCSVLGLALFPPSAGEELPQETPTGYVEDFERREVLDVVYDGWERVRSPAHPAYNEIFLREDPSGARSGRFYLRMNTLGGHTAFRMLPARAWAIDPGRSYTFRAWVRLLGTRSNTAAVTLTWLGPRHEPLAEDRSVPIPRAGDWTEIALEVLRVPPGARHVAVTLRFEGVDVRGSCDFDLLELAGRVRLDIAPSDRRLPVFDPWESPRFQISVPGLPAGTYHLQAVTRAPDGRAAARPGPLTLSPARPALLELPPHRAGYYELQITLFRGEEEIARRVVPLLVPNPGPPPSRSLFGAALNPFTTDYAGLTELMRLGGFRQARLTLWDRPAEGRRRAPEPDRILAMLREIGETDPHAIVGVLAAPPEGMDVDRETGRHGPLALLGEVPQVWEPALRSVLKDFRGHVTHWQIGGETYASAASRPGAAAALKTAREILQKLDRTARLGVPVGSPRERPEEADFASLLLVPADPISDFPPGELFGLMPPPGGTRFSQAAALLKNLVRHAAQGPRTAAVFLPLEASPLGGLLDPDGYPQAALLALRAANELLSGAVFRKDLQLFDPPAHGYVFEREGRILAAAWSEGSETELDLDLGEEAEIFPPLGEARPLRGGERLRLGEMPVFLRNVDLGRVQTQRSLVFEDPREGGPGPARLPLQLDPAPKRLRFRNAFSSPAGLTEVRVRLSELPPGWRAEPSFLEREGLAAGEDFEGALLFRLPRDASEGPHEIGLELSFRQEGRLRTIRLRRRLEAVPLLGIVMERIPAGEGQTLQVRIVNRSSRAVRFLARIRLPGNPERKEPMSLPASAETILSFAVPDGPADRVAEVLCEEFGGTRLHARKVFPLR